jgi:hypothetical protein
LRLNLALSPTIQGQHHEADDRSPPTPLVTGLLQT